VESPHAPQNIALSQKAYRNSAYPKMLTIYRLFPKSLPNVNISQKARRISALAEELVNYRVGPYPNSMRNIDHTCRACRKSDLPEELAGHQKYIRTGFDLLHVRMVPAHQPVKQGEQTTVILSLHSKGAEKKSVFHACSNAEGTGNAQIMRLRSPIHMKVKSPNRVLRSTFPELWTLKMETCRT
jgi:hypothetical protein